MTKIASISPKGVPHMVVYYDKEAKQNPYRVYLEWCEAGEHGNRQRKKQIMRYADLGSCGALIAQYAIRHNEEGR